MTSYDVVLFTDMSTQVWHAKTLGAYRLATELRQHGYSTKVIDWAGEWLSSPGDFFKLLNLIIGDNTLFIGFSGTFFTQVRKIGPISTWKEFSQSSASSSTWPIPQQQLDLIFMMLRKKYPHVKIVYGGSNNSNLVIDSVDFVVKGLADTTIIELANHLKNKTALKFMSTGSRAKVIDYDMRAQGFDFKHSVTHYQQEDHILPGEVLPLETSRGCLFKCSFCDYPLIGRKKGDPAYHKTVDTMAREFRHNYETYQVNKYMFVDDTFNETTEKIQELIRARDLSGVDIEFSCYLRADLIARFPEQTALLKDLGLQTAFLGIESLHKTSAMAIGKSTDPERIKDTIYSIKDQSPDIRIAGGFIIGLPDDNPVTLETWIPWLLKKDNPIDSFSVVPLGMANTFVGSEISQYPEKFGYTITNKQTGNWENKFWNYATAKEYADSVMQQAWESSRLRIAGYYLLGMQNNPILYERFKNSTLNNLDFELLDQDKKTQWETYRDLVFSYKSV